MNTKATSSQNLHDAFIFLFGVALATGVLLVLYFALSLGKTDSNAVSEDDTPTVVESIEESSPSPSQERQASGSNDVDSLADILTIYSGTFDRFAALYSLVSQSDEQKLVDLLNDSLTNDYSESDDA